MRDRRSFAVHDLLGTNNLATKGSADGLMTQAHAQNRHFTGVALDDIHGHACLGG